LVTGPTGSGKSTTMSRIIDEVNQVHEKMIITVEDPIEYLHKPKKSVIVQREIGPDAMTFKDALIAAMRQDPDVILIGEIRDQATASAAIEAAQTGHLVFATLHTQDTVRTVNRVMDLFPPEERDTARVLFAESCIGILSQMLLPRKTGGRVAAMEVLKVNLRVRDLIKDENRTPEIYEVLEDSRADGMQSFDDHLSELYEADLIDYDTGMLAATSSQKFKMAATQIHEKRKIAAGD
ncbi:MAG: ATPase, T2SS/T4P/T4SS family, partial [Deinococcota bacterium]